MSSSSSARNRCLRRGEGERRVELESFQGGVNFLGKGVHGPGERRGWRRGQQFGSRGRPARPRGPAAAPHRISTPPVSVLPLRRIMALVWAALLPPCRPLEEGSSCMACAQVAGAAGACWLGSFTPLLLPSQATTMQLRSLPTSLVCCFRIRTSITRIYLQVDAYPTEIC